MDKAGEKAGVVVSDSVDDTRGEKRADVVDAGENKGEEVVEGDAHARSRSSRDSDGAGEELREDGGVRSATGGGMRLCFCRKHSNSAKTSGKVLALSISA